LAARPFVHREGKSYRTRGKEVQIGDAKAALDAFVVFAGFAMAPMGEGALTIDEAVRKARAAYKRGQRAYRERRSAERLKQLEAEMPERIKQLQERKAAQDAEKQTQAAEEATSQNGRKR
jgi:membrane protein involved in colicin uptake